MLQDGERASARTGEVCLSEFGRRAALVDHLELLAGRAIGGPTAYLAAEAEWAEASALEAVPTTAADFRWIALRLARAVENGWTGEAAAPLIAAARG